MNIDILKSECRNDKEAIKMAGRMVNIDLENPIDLSQMRVINVFQDAIRDDSDRYYMIRRSELSAYVFNDEGDKEELKITFELKSQRGTK